MPSQSNPSITLVQKYLAACEARRLEDAQTFLASTAELTFPGGRYGSVDAMVAAARERYRWVKKVALEWDAVLREDGAVAVVNTGTLYGENLNGVPFEGIRYIDRFIIRDGKIVNQQVWNDLDVSGVLTRTTR